MVSHSSCARATLSISKAELTAMFPTGVSVSIAEKDMYTGELPLQEFQYIRKAVPKRQREFTAGRNSARQALQSLGATAPPILMDSHRAPIWPPGIVGTITHCDGFCAAAVAKDTRFSGLGMDAEIMTSKGTDIPYSDMEMVHFFNLRKLTKLNWEIIAFSAKEAFFKSYYPNTKFFLELGDVEVAFSLSEDRNKGEFKLTVQKESAPNQGQYNGKWLVKMPYVFTACAIHAV
jgi:4'-phosphopantetheinyl transferase EntD